MINQTQLVTSPSMTEMAAICLDEMLMQYQSHDNAIVDVSELDGLLTAIACINGQFHPQKWLSAIWYPGQEPKWQSPHHRDTFYGLVYWLQQVIIQRLLYQPFLYSPLFNQLIVFGKEFTSVDSWCMGFMRGVQLFERSWRRVIPHFSRVIEPITIHLSESGWDYLDTLSEAEVDYWKQKIAPTVLWLYAHWQSYDASSEKLIF